MIQIYNNKHLTWDGTTSINHYELFADTVTDLPSDPYYFSSPDGGKYKMAQGSIAWVIDVSEIYMLDSEGTWVLETVSGGGTTDYDALTNKPSINNVELSGNKTLSDLGIQPVIDSSHKLSADLVTDGTTNKFNMQADWTQTDNTSGDYIKNKPTLGTAAAKDVPVSGNASTTQVVMGDDSRLSDSRTPTAHNQASDTINAMTGYTAPVNPTTWQTVSASDTLNAATQKIVNNEELNKSNISFVQQMNGKSPNLINTYDIDTIKSLNTDGVWTNNTYTLANNGSITINTDGTIAVDGNFITGVTFNLQLLSLDDGEYYFSGCPLGGSAAVENGYFLAIKFQRGGTQYIVDVGNGNFYTKISGDTNITLQLWVRPHTTINNLLWKIYFVSKAIYDSGYSNYQPYALSNAELTAKEQTNETNITTLQGKVKAHSEGGTNYDVINGIRVYVSATQPTGDIPAGSLWIGG